MDKLKYIRIQQENNQYNGDIPIGADATNIDLKNGNNLQDTIGDYDYKKQGNIKEKFNNISNDFSSEVIKRKTAISNEKQQRIIGDNFNSTQISALSSRVDQFTHLEDGSTSGDAELKDIRVKVDGTKAESAGNAVREQIFSINKFLEESYDEKFQKQELTWAIGSYIDGSGKIGSNTSAALSSFCYCNYGDEIANKSSNKDMDNRTLSFYLHLYDTNGIWISRILLRNGETFKIDNPEISKYRITFGRATSYGVIFTENDIEQYFSYTQRTSFPSFYTTLSYKADLMSGDLNDFYSISGVYYLASASTKIIQNTPVQEGGFLIVFANPLGRIAIQMYITTSQGIYIRYKTVSSGWTSWKEYKDSLNKKGSILEGNLDDYIDQGIYTLTNSASEEIENTPINKGGHLMVFYSTPVAMQMYIDNEASMYIRYKTSFGWTKWVAYNNNQILYPDTSKDARFIAYNLSNIKKQSKAKYNTLPYEEGYDTSRTYEIDEPIGGVIYSSAWRNGDDVYWNKTLETYYSALANPASILYTKTLDDLNIYNAHAAMGGVCSSFVSKILNFPFYTTTEQLAKTLVDKDIVTLYQIEVGDILLKDGHIAFISQIYTNSNGIPTSVDITEQVFPFAKTTNVLFTNLKQYLESRGYTVKQNTFGSPKYLGDPQYAEDIIFEKGNNTYVDISEKSKMLFYIPSGDTVYYMKAGDNEYNSIQLNTVETEIINQTIVYDLSQIFTEVGNYILTTNPINEKKCLIKIINTGTFIINNNILTLSGYQNCTPIQYYMIELKNKTTTTNTPAAFFPPEGYYGSWLNIHHFIDSDSIQIEDIPTSRKYKLCIDFETGVGYKRVFTNNIGI